MQELSPEGTARYQRNPDHIVSILWAKIVDSNELPESRFFLTQRGFCHFIKFDNFRINAAEEIIEEDI